MSVQNGQHPIELVGEVRAVTLWDDEDSGGEMQFRLDDGATVAVDFSEEHEARLAVALRYHQSRRIQITGLGDFGPDGKLRRVCRLDTQLPEWLALARAAPPTPVKPGTARAAVAKWIEFGKTIPEEELAKFPTDFAENMDHYLYGSPKRGEE